MDAYRLHFVDEDGARLGVFEFTSADDSLATQAARQFGCERGADLWCGPRRVGSWRSARAATAAPSPAAAGTPAGFW
ncbi:MAG TPA: hypothetical protein VJS38_08445 [Phenylobacterium sp.]|uniref:hypothetical protein n=1 Tax=Phenylobacterium sp. TaxID=1871053 RepID=UPI002B49F301|nr:hypothetical protein [Phenylobacterium sp.]HKR88194.1 hypothetical protein [Phenylobacterium sp.]